MSTPNRRPPARRAAHERGPHHHTRSAHRHARTEQRRRLHLLWLGTVVALVVLVARLTMVQVLDSSRYTAYAAGEIQQKVTLPATRGAVYDRNGQVLALSVDTKDVVADDFQITDPAREAATLSRLLGQSVSRLTQELSQKNGYVVLVKGAQASLVSRLQASSLAGLSYLPDSQRVSPDASLFEPLLGGLDASGRGVAGLEELKNPVLSGTPGSEVVAEGPDGSALPGAPTKVVAARRGQSIVLTIDQSLQLEVTRDVEAEMQAQHAQSGIAVIESVQTGAILAMVDLVRDAKGKIVTASSNLAVTSIYQPGSVMKLATFSYALKNGVITPSTSFVVPYSTQIGGYTFQDSEYHPTQTMTASQILDQSSNVGTIEVASRLGMTGLGQAFHALGFGQATGLNWPGESAGLVGSSTSWVGSDQGSVPIGTGVAVTPQQILDAYTAVANHGMLPTPHLVQAVVSSSASSPSQKAVAVAPARRALPSWVAAELVPMLEGVVQDGTAVCAEVPGYAVAGKTGTAQVPSSTGYVPGDFNATFVGFVPAQAPKLAGIVVLNHPATIYGGSVAAPVFSQIMQYALRHFAVAPTGTATPTPQSCSTTSGQ